MTGLLASFGDHAGFIAAAYAVTVLVIVGLIVWIRVDGAAQHRQLADLERRGVRRRSQSQGEGKA